MTTIIEVYPSNLPGEPLERHVAHEGTLHEWLSVKCPSYFQGKNQPISASIDGVIIPPDQWHRLQLTGQRIELRPNPQDPVTALWVIGGLLVVSLALMRPKVPSFKGMGTQGQELSAAGLKANNPRLNGVIPEIAGRYRVYPDYLCQPRRYFTTPTKQAVDTMLCVGTGEFDIDSGDIYIGETRIDVLESVVDYAIFAPGANVTGHPGHQNWYNAPEVGASTGSAGLRLIAGNPGTPSATASSYVVDADTIAIPTGAGVAPQDWDVGNIVAIVARIRSFSVTDGGGANRDIVTGEFSDLDLAVDDLLLITGAGSNDGRYKIVTLTLTSSTDQMTLDKWVSVFSGTDEFGNPIYTEGWEPASSMIVGSFFNVEVQKPRVRTVTTSGPFGPVTETTYTATEYRIIDLIEGDIPGGTGVVGWQFQRLNPDGTDDTTWIGFFANVTTSLISIVLEASQTVGGWLGPFKATPKNEFTQLVEFDIFAPMGLGYVNRDSGAVEARTKFFEVQWRANDNSWVPGTFSVSGQSRDQLGFTFDLPLPSSSTNVELRIRRLGAEDKSVEALDRIEWYGLKSKLVAPASYAGVTTMAITLEGSDKISSRSENQINMLVQRKINGVATRSIDDWVRYVCTSIGYAADDLNEAELTALAAIWDSRGDWFDFAFVTQTTVKDALATALRVGFSELTVDAGKIRPVRDQARTTFEHLYTPQNMTGGLRRQFTAADPDDYDGVDVEYTDGETWEQETVECRLPGDVGTRVEKVKLEGVTDRTRAWRIGMRQRRLQVYRRKSYSWDTEWDALNSRYLSFCAVSDDVPGYGQSALLVSFANVSGGVELQSTEPLKWEIGASHVVALRRPDGTLFGPQAATRVNDYRVRIAVPLDFVPVTGGAVEATHLLFGTVTNWSYPVLITEISPSGDTVEVSAVNYDARIYADDDNTPA